MDNAHPVTGPGSVLIFHGHYDDVVPFSHGEELARTARQARFVPLACAHNDCPPDPAEFWRNVEGFLRDATGALMSLSLNKPKLDNLANEIWKSAERQGERIKA